MAGVKVSLANFDQNTDNHHRYQGTFLVYSARRVECFIPIGPQDRMNNWSIIIEQGPLEITGYKRSHLGGAFSGYSYRDHITLVCDVSLSRKILATRIIILYAGRILIANNFALGAFLTDWIVLTYRVALTYGENSRKHGQDKVS